MKKLQNLLRSIFKFQTVKSSIFAVLFLTAALPLTAQTVNTVGTSVFYSRSTANDPDIAYCNFQQTDTNTALVGNATSSTSLYDVSYVNTALEQSDGGHYWKPESNRTSNDPWVSSALIEYDQPYPTPTSVQYPNHCLGLCASYSCSNLPVGQSTYSVAFPIQRVTFDIFKYYNGKNPKNADDTPTVRSIDIYPAQNTKNYKNYTCGSYHCTNAGRDDTDNSVIVECLGAHWVCDGAVVRSSGSSPLSITTAKCCFKNEEGGSAEGFEWTGCAFTNAGCGDTSAFSKVGQVKCVRDSGATWTCTNTTHPSETATETIPDRVWAAGAWHNMKFPNWTNDKGGGGGGGGGGGSTTTYQCAFANLFVSRQWLGCRKNGSTDEFTKSTYVQCTNDGECSGSGYLTVNCSNNFCLVPSASATNPFECQFNYTEWQGCREISAGGEFYEDTGIRCESGPTGGQCSGTGFETTQCDMQVTGLHTCTINRKPSNTRSATRGATRALPTSSYVTDDGPANGVRFELINNVTAWKGSPVTNQSICFSGMFRMEANPNGSTTDSSGVTKIEMHMNAPQSTSGGWPHYNQNVHSLAYGASYTWELIGENTTYTGTGQGDVVIVGHEPLSKFVGWGLMSTDLPGARALRVGQAVIGDDGDLHNNDFVLHVVPFSNTRFELGKTYHLVVDEITSNSFNCGSSPTPTPTWEPTGATDVTGYTCHFTASGSTYTWDWCREKDGGPQVGPEVISCTVSGTKALCDGRTIMAASTCELSGNPWCEAYGGPYRTTQAGVEIQKWVCDITSSGMGDTCRFSGTTVTKSSALLGMSCTGSSSPFTCSSTSIPPLTRSCPDAGVTTCEMYYADTGSSPTPPGPSPDPDPDDPEYYVTGTNYCWPSYMTRIEACGTEVGGTYSLPGGATPRKAGEEDLTSTINCWNYAEMNFNDDKDQCDYASDATTYQGCCTKAGHSDCVFFDNNGRESNQPMHFCTAWDGHYEIAGEFGKSNGNYGFRATAYTNVPSDGVINDRIEIEEVGIYPGHNGATQIPIQLDVTNVHTVRSTPSLVGALTPVSAQPYTFSYRLSKDADVRIALYDASTLDNAAYAYGDVPGDNTTNEASFADGGDYTAATGTIVRTLVDWQPRTGEGIKGKESDTQIADFDSWDGRHDEGFLLPAGNYIASLQAKSQDEWRGIDFSRAVTKQVSLDPLKLTDIRVTGLNKKSTAYATISYVLTESSTLYWEVYTPGTTFNNGGSTTSDILTDSSTATGTGPTPVGGSLVYRFSEQRSGRMNYTERWNGLCQNQDANGNPLPCVRTYAAGEKMSDGRTATAGQTETFAYGAPMPDGNYVYVLWAEIPYNGKYVNAMGSADNKSPAFTSGSTCARSGKEINNQCFTGVKTLKYTIGNLELERGLVGITMQPATYATLGSSPTAYGLDPFIFKYALDRDAQVVATVENTYGIVVKHLTLEEGSPNVSQQLNTLTWDGRDDQGRMVYPGTYMFRVRANDAMFPAQSNEAITIFPVDMYRVVDVATTDVYGDSNAKATISYHLSKPMNAQINIYNKDIVIPNYNSTTGEYNDAKVSATYNGQRTGVTTLNSVVITPVGGSIATSGTIPANGSYVAYGVCGSNVCRNTWSSASERSITGNRDLNEDLNKQGAGSNEPATGTYTVYLKQEVLDVTTDTDVAWPPRLCNRSTDAAIFTSGYVDPAKVNTTKRACIYVNDTSFTNYPSNAAEAASGVVDVRLQPIHTFDREHLSTGDDFVNMVEWDALYFYNPTPNASRHSADEIAKCRGSKEKANCPYEMIPDGQYPFTVSARSNDVFNRYYYDAQRDGTMSGYTLSGQPFKEQSSIKQENYLYASDKVVAKLNVTRGPVYFLEDTVQVYANAPQLFNASSSTLTFIPPYEINFAISRAATVEIAIVAMEPGMCSPVTDNVLSSTVNVYESRTNKAGDICKFLSTMTIRNTGNFDANVIRKAYWDGTDHTGNYVKPGQYTVRLTARNYPDAGLYQPTVKDIPLVANLLKVYDLVEADNYSISVRGQDMKIGYQISVPMKVAIQIFKPGTTIYDYSKGTLRNPTTGREVKDIREVLVRAITGIRPGTTLIEEVWDGLDYAQQEVPDGVYPFRFVTSLDSAAIDSVTGEILFGDDTSTDANQWKVARVADTYEYQNLHKATIAIGDGRFVCEDWQKTVFFYPNPFNNPSKGTLEITKMPVPGTVSIKYFNLAGDLVRDSDYNCVDANNYQTTMGKNLYFQPDNNVSTTRVDLDAFNNVRNAALRCRWDRTNQHGKKVARGVYFGLVDFKAYNGREHCQKVVKILIP